MSTLYTFDQAQVSIHFSSVKCVIHLFILAIKYDTKAFVSPSVTEERMGGVDSGSEQTGLWHLELGAVTQN